MHEIVHTNPHLATATGQLTVSGSDGMHQSRDPNQRLLSGGALSSLLHLVLPFNFACDWLA